jgi:uncharacterized protein (TIGR02757 family)
VGARSSRRTPGAPLAAADLGRHLDRMYREFNQADAIADPVNLVRRYRAPEDREVAGFCAAALAFGRVASVNQSIAALYDLVGPAPARYVRSFDPARELPRFEPFVHRWTRGRDLVALLWVLRQMLERSGSVERFLLEGDDASAPDVGPALDSFGARALAIDVRPIYGRRPPRPGLAYFFPRPCSGSACKRLNLFLRWMVRRDDVDLGVWTRVSPSRLVVPLDTHVIRLGRCLRLTRYRSPGWKMAAEITATLRTIDPEDPVRFDFSICHVGMMGGCGFGHAHGDTRCPFRGACHPMRSAERGMRRSHSDAE